MKKCTCIGWIDWGVFGESGHISGSSYRCSQHVRQIVVLNAAVVWPISIKKGKCQRLMIDRAQHKLQGISSLGLLTADTFLTMQCQLAWPVDNLISLMSFFMMAMPGKIVYYDHCSYFRLWWSNFLANDLFQNVRVSALTEPSNYGFLLILTLRCIDWHAFDHFLLLAFSFYYPIITDQLSSYIEKNVNDRISPVAFSQRSTTMPNWPLISLNDLPFCLNWCKCPTDLLVHFQSRQG